MPPSQDRALKLDAAGFWVLQTLRVCTVITLLVTAASCWVLIIKVDKYKTFFVFQCISFFFTSMGCLFLIVAEFPIIKVLRSFYEQFWPVLSDTHGVGWMGAAIAIIGFHVLGSLNEQGYDTDTFAGLFSQLVLASGILCVLFGCLNIIAALIWRDGEHNITSRMIRKKGSLARQENHLPSHSATFASSVYKEKPGKNRLSMPWVGRGGNKRPNISAPLSNEPQYGQPEATSRVVPGLQRPDSALHPVHGRPDRTSSEYSLDFKDPRN